MPVISVFYGIIIRINFLDHNPPHFHAEYQGFDGVFEIKSGKMVLGELPKNAEKIVTQWAIKNRAELLKNWNRAIEGKPLTRIPGADQ